jgi:cell division septation protein DedD
LKRIKSKGFNGYVWSLTNKNGVVTYKVQVAAFSSKAKAQNFVETLKKRNISSFISVN